MVLDYDEIADILDKELSGMVERCYYGDKDCILRSNPAIHPNRRYNHPTERQIRQELG